MSNEHNKKISQIIAKSWLDEGFKKKLLEDPVATLKAEGVKFPNGLNIQAHENTDKTIHLVIPRKPTDLSDEDINVISNDGRRSLPTNITSNICDICNDICTDVCVDP